MDRTDEELIAAYVAGDEQAFAELVERHVKGVYSFVFRLIGNPHESEDVTQEIFMRVWKNIKKYNVSTSRFKTWTLRIARNAAIDYLRKKKHPVVSDFEGEDGENALLDSAADPAPLQDEEFARTEKAEVLAKASLQLSEQHREILILHYTNQLSFEEIAETLGEPQNTVKSRHHRALIALRKILIPSTKKP